MLVAVYNPHQKECAWIVETLAEIGRASNAGLLSRVLPTPAALLEMAQSSLMRPDVIVVARDFDEASDTHIVSAHMSTVSAHIPPASAGSLSMEPGTFTAEKNTPSSACAARSNASFPSPTNGIALVTQLREVGYRGAILVSAADDTQVFEALDAGATNYLVTTHNDFTERLRRALSAQAVVVEAAHSRGIRLKGRNGAHLVPLSQVRYFSADRHTISGHWGQNVESLEYRSTLDHLEKQYSDLGFVRCHRSFVVNTAHVTDTHPYEVVLSSGEQLPIGRRYQAALKQLTYAGCEVPSAN